MKKLKLLIAFCALLLGVGNASALTLETDLTSQFNSLANTKWTNSSGQVGWAAPQVTTNSGLTVAAWERYESSCNWTGDIMYSTVTGLEPGTYKIELYGAAAFTFNRGFGSTAFTGDLGKATSDTYKENEAITENTGVTLYAETSEGQVAKEIPIWYATNFNTSGIATVVLEDVVVGNNGTIKIGLSKTSTSTNWHVVQLKGVTATVDGDAVITNLKNTANGLLNNATYANVIGAERTNLAAAYAATPAENTQEAYQTVIANLNTAISAFEGCDVAAYNAYAAEKAKATALGMTSLDTYDPANAAAASTQTQALMVAEYNYVTTNYSHAVSLDTWTKTNAIDRSGQHWDGTTTSTYSEQNEGWGSSSWSCSYSQNIQLPAGNYVFKVAGRKSSNDATLTLTVKNGEEVLGTVNDFPNGDTGKGIETSGAANFGNGDYANNGTGRGWQWRYVKFTLADPATVNVAVTASATAQYQWVGFCNPTVQTDDADNVALMEALVNLNDAKAAATLEKRTANVGTGVFQYDETTNESLWNAYSTAKSNAEDYEFTSSSTASEVNALATALTTAITNYQSQSLNAPAAGDVFNVMITTGDDYAFKNNPLTFNADNASGAYFPQGVGVKAYKAQQITFTQVAENQYTMSMVDANGNAVYVRTNATDKGGNGTNVQIRLTTEAANALVVRVEPTATEGVYHLWNTEADALLGCQDDPAKQTTGGLYTTNNHNDFTITVATKPSVSINIGSNVKYATCIFPFKPTLPSGVVAKSCTASIGNELTLEDVAEPAANVPYILYAENGYEGTLTGFGTATETSYTEGWLTGVYESTTANAGTYVLQNNNDKVAFYLVAAGEEPTVGANRCYLTIPAAGARAAFFFPGSITGVNNVAAAAAEAEVKDGKYIENGKVVIVKNGKKFSATGAQMK